MPFCQDLVLFFLPYMVTERNKTLLGYWLNGPVCVSKKKKKGSTGLPVNELL